MIEKIINIRSISSLSGFISTDPAQLEFIDFNSEPEHEGGFGNIHVITQTNPDISDKLLLKVFHDEEKARHGVESIKGLHDKLKRREKNTGFHCLNEAPELLGLPFIIFEGYNEITQDNVIGLVVLNLNDLNYLDFGLDNTSHPYTEIELEERFVYAYQLARIVNFLEELKFVHSDIKEDAIWINIQNKQLALIDYDSGYHHDLQLRPSTIGALNQWASNQWRRLIKDKTLNDEIKTRDRIANEHWVLANALFQILYTTVPYFFLKDANPETKEAYLENDNWPKIDMNNELAKSDLEASYHSVIELFENITEHLGPLLFETFEKTFNDGLTRKISQRPTPANWQKITAEINFKLGNEPKIEEFEVHQTEIKSEFDQVEISFSFGNYTKASVNGKRLNFRDRETSIVVNEDGKIKLVLENDYASVSREIQLKVRKEAPKILSFNSSEFKRLSLASIELSWFTENCHKVELYPTNESNLSLNQTLAVFPNRTTEYKLVAYGSFGQKTSSSLIIEVPGPVIVNFNYEINIEKGIHNIDLSWAIENATHCEISPFIGKETSNGTKSVDIYEKTKFKLIAHGYFGEVNTELIAIPFPKPIIEKLLVPTPQIHIEAHIQNSPLQLVINNSIEFSASPEYFKDLNIKPIPLNESVELLPFVELAEDTNSISNHEALNHSWFNNAFTFVKKKLSENEHSQ
jgi:serine/threonine protein kinase